MGIDTVLGEFDGAQRSVPQCLGNGNEAHIPDRFRHGRSPRAP